MTDFLGQQLGNYRLIGLIGQGGFADVYQGEHIHLGTYAAIKVLKTQVAAEDIERFRNEARLIVNLKNPHIVPVLDFGIQNGTPFLVMEYAVNGTLRQRHPRGSIVPLDTIVSYAKQVAAALQYAHDHHVIHRDVKPENMLLAPNNEVWLSDFGIALIAQSTQTSASMQNMAGSLLYMAPEQIQGYPCAASDQYSLAVVVYEWLSGTAPFRGSYIELAMQHMQASPPSLVQSIPTLSPMIESVVFKALAKDPKQRYVRVQAFAEDLERAYQFTKRASPPAIAEAAIFGPTGRMVLGSTILTIGRQQDNQLVVNDLQVSQHHAEVHPQGQGYAITDLESTNGTFVNEQRLSPHVARLLNAGDTIRVGNTRLNYEASVSPFEKTRHMPPQPMPPQPIPSGSVIPTWLRHPAGIVAVMLVVLLILTSLIVRTILTSLASPMGLTPDQVTATAYAKTATATIANQNPYPPFGGTLALNDPLSNNSKGYKWDIGNFANNNSCTFTEGAYHVVSGHQSFFFACNPEAVTFTNFAFQVQMTIVKGNSGGIDFRQVGTQGAAYYFTIAIDGSYSFDAFDGTKDTTLMKGNSSMIKTGPNQLNLIAVVAQGNNIVLYVNLQQIYSTTNSTSSTGLIGLVADDVKQPSEVAFNNAKVWTL